MTRMDIQAPRSIQIDASSHCQLACPVCPTASGATRPVLGAGHLKLSDFERLLDRNTEIAEVELSNYGEMFLNPQLPELLACAWERNVTVSGSNGVNLNFASEAALDAIVRYRVKALTCSIDGATQESYAKYRINGNLDRVLAHVDKIRELRRAAGSAFPILDWQFVAMGHNEHEIETARAMAVARGMHFFPRLSWSPNYSPIVNGELVRIQTGLGAATREEFRTNKGVEYTRDICYQLWKAPVINWDGKMLGCCVNYWGDFGGNVFTGDLATIMDNPKLNYARGMLMGKNEARPDIPCSRCNQYEAIRDRNGWISEEEIPFASKGEVLVGAVATADPGVRFARISVSDGDANGPNFDVAGKLFRFGTDTAFYFRVEQGRSFTVWAQGLGSSGWGRLTRRVFQLSGRPACQQIDVHVDAGPVEGPLTRGPVDAHASPMVDIVVIPRSNTAPYRKG